ncbi:NAD-dependent epimerase/dehydratase family protein [Alphaproteobacteria bacterium]|nr:NAD-dependent epimerase/dehydratase family protein [Alphaproteobacteria bacterium]MDB9825041.1 NAD-dependent epimerase/dehydratase family protein [Alphaproteobacteria bacterium]
MHSHSRKKYGVLITGSNGFIGKNILLNLKTVKGLKIYKHTRNDSESSLINKINLSDIIYHTAAEVRSKKKTDFINNNHVLTKVICESLIKKKNKTKIIFISTAQIKKKDNYGISKKMAESEVIKLNKNKKIIYKIVRLPNVFGKYAKPNHNSVVANFCFNISREKKIYISNKNFKLKLIYIDTVIDILINNLNNNKSEILNIKSDNTITLGKLAETIKNIKYLKSKNINQSFSNQLERNLYSTYVYYLADNKLINKFTSHIDKRGKFAELFRNETIGQFSYFTIMPLETRGGHFHNSKIEKFIVLKGNVTFNLTDAATGKTSKIKMKDSDNTIFEIKPGISHSITNMNNDLSILLVWSNEIFDISRPDTLKYDE